MGAQAASRREEASSPAPAVMFRMFIEVLFWRLVVLWLLMGDKARLAVVQMLPQHGVVKLPVSNGAGNLAAFFHQQAVAGEISNLYGIPQRCVRGDTGGLFGQAFDGLAFLPGLGLEGLAATGNDGFFSHIRCV